MFFFSEMSKSGAGSKDESFKAGTNVVVPRSWEPAPGSPGFGCLLAGQRCPESRSAVMAMKRPCASGVEDNCGLGGKTGEVKHLERC